MCWTQAVKLVIGEVRICGVCCTKFKRCMVLIEELCIHSVLCQGTTASWDLGLRRGGPLDVVGPLPLTGCGHTQGAKTTSEPWQSTNRAMQSQASDKVKQKLLGAGFSRCTLNLKHRSDRLRIWRSATHFKIVQVDALVVKLLDVGYSIRLTMLKPQAGSWSMRIHCWRPMSACHCYGHLSKAVTSQISLTHLPKRHHFQTLWKHLLHSFMLSLSTNMLVPRCCNRFVFFFFLLDRFG